jgi:hypothetical protein
MREVNEGLQAQAPAEEIQYRLTVTPAPVAVSAIVVTDTSTGADVTASCMPGAATVASGVITLPVLKALVAGHEYTIRVLYSDGVSLIEPVIKVLCN